MDNVRISGVNSYLLIDQRIIVHQGTDVVVYEFCLDAGNSASAKKVCTEDVQDHVVVFSLREKFYTDYGSSHKVAISSRGYYYETHHKIDIGHPEFDLCIRQKHRDTEISRCL